MIFNEYCLFENMPIKMDKLLKCLPRTLNCWFQNRKFLAYMKAYIISVRMNYETTQTNNKRKRFFVKKFKTCFMHFFTWCL